MARRLAPLAALAEAAAWLALVALAAALSLQKIRSFDYWWHLRTGRLIAETGAVPHADPFSFTAHGERWVDVHWLHQLGLHALHALGGHAAVSLGVLAAVLLVVALLACAGRRPGRAALAVGVIALALLAMANRLMPRPELPSFVLLVAELALLERFAARGGDAAWSSWATWTIWAIVPLQLVWANLHGLFAVGLALVAIHLVGSGIDALRGDPQARRRAATLAGVLLLSFGVSFVNPNGADAVLFPLRQLRMIATPELRAAEGLTALELASPLTSWRTMAPLEIAAPLGLAALAGLAVLLRGRALRAADLLQLAAFAGLGLAAQRNIALFALAAVPVAVRNLNALVDRLPARFSVARVAPAAALLVALAVGAAAADSARGRLALRLGALRQPGLGVMEVLHPVGAANWVARAKPPGPLFHHMADGGYLIWRLHPEWSVLLDGRLEVYGPERVAALHVLDPARFRGLDARYHFGTVLLNHGQFRFRSLIRALAENPHWRLGFADDAALVFVREPEAARFARFDVTTLPPLTGPADEADLYRRLARIELLQTLGHAQRAYRLSVETRERHPGSFEP